MECGIALILGLTDLEKGKLFFYEIIRFQIFGRQYQKKVKFLS